MMVSTRIDRETMSSPSDGSRDDILERMLKDAEELALKMSRQSESNTNSRAGSVVSTDCANSNEHGVVTMADDDDDDDDDDDEDDDGNMVSGTLDEHQYGNRGLEAMLRKSEALLGKMRSRSPTNHVVQSTGGAPSPSVVCPPRTSPTAPTSVYLLDPSNGLDDVSSVGSSSLRSPAASPGLRMPFIALTPEGRPIQEDEPLEPSPLRPFMVSSVGKNGIKDEMPRYRDSGEALANWHKRTPMVHPTPPRPTPYTPPHEFPRSDHAASAVSPSSIPVAGTVLLDFSQSPYDDGKWERVDSAREEDPDYVPLADYSKLPKMNTPIRHTRGSSGSTSSVDSSFSVDGDWSMRNNSGFNNVSRVAAFRAKKKRTRRRQRLIKAAAVLVTCIFACACYYFFRGCNQATLASGKIGDSLSPDAISPDQGALPQEETGIFQVEDGDSWNTIANCTNEIDTCGEVNNGEDTCMVEHLPLTGVDNGVDELVDLASEQETDERNDLYPEEPADKNTDTNDQLEVASQTVEEAPLSVEYDSVLERKCMNPFHRFFNKQCRIQTRRRRRTKGVHVLNLQASAFL